MQPQVLLLRENRSRLLVGIRGDDHFGEDLRDRFRCGGVERPVGGDDPAECGHAVAGKRLAPCFEQIGARRDAARVGVLDDHDGRVRFAELGDQLQRGIRIVDIVVAEFLALDLFGLGDAAGVRPGGNVEGSLLMRILSVAKWHLQRGREGPAFRPALLLVAKSKPLRDHGIVGGSQRERLGRHALAEFERRRPAVAFQLGEELFIVCRIGDDRHVGVVLRGRTDHRGTADVDILNDFVATGAPHEGRFERIEIDDDEVDRRDSMLLHRRCVPGIVAHSEKSAVHLWMERLHPPIHHLREAGNVTNVTHFGAAFAQFRRGASGRNQLDTAS
jgi:hypothetical protein